MSEYVFLRLLQVLQIIPVSKSTWWAGIREGIYPKPIKLSERTSAWLKSDIDALCERLRAAGHEPREQGKANDTSDDREGQADEDHE
jgi:prophage regulatory protein